LRHHRIAAVRTIVEHVSAVAGAAAQWYSVRGTMSSSAFERDVRAWRAGAQLAGHGVRGWDNRREGHMVAAKAMALTAADSFTDPMYPETERRVRSPTRADLREDATRDRKPAIDYRKYRIGLDRHTIAIGALECRRGEIAADSEQAL
jgi:hypothetical protein